MEQISKESINEFRKAVKVELLKIAEKHNLEYLTEDEANEMVDSISDFTIIDCIEEDTTPEEYADLMTY